MSIVTERMIKGVNMPNQIYNPMIHGALAANERLAAELNKKNMNEHLHNINSPLFKQPTVEIPLHTEDRSELDNNQIKPAIKNNKLQRAVATGLVFLTMLLFAGCGPDKYYTYTVDETTQVLVLKEVKKGTQDAYTLDWFGKKYEGYTIYFNTAPTPTPDKTQTDLADYLVKNTTEFAKKSNETYVEYVDRVVEETVNKYLANNKLNNYKYIKLFGELTQPLYTNGNLILFFNAINNTNGKISLGCIEITLNKDNKRIVDDAFIAANSGNLDRLVDGIRCSCKILSDSKNVNMSQEMDKDIVADSSYALDSISKRYSFDENNIRFDSAPGTLVFYKGKLQFIRIGKKGGEKVTTVTPVTMNTSKYELNSLGFVFTNEEDGQNWTEFYGNPMHYYALGDIDYSLQNQK